MEIEERKIKILPKNYQASKKEKFQNHTFLIRGSVLVESAKRVLILSHYWKTLNT